MRAFDRWRSRYGAALVAVAAVLAGVGATVVAPLPVAAAGSGPDDVLAIEVYTPDGPQLLTMRTLTGEQHLQPMPSDAATTSFDIAPGTNMVAYASDAGPGSAVAAVNLDGTGKRFLEGPLDFDFNLADVRPQWSADGDKVVWCEYEADSSRLMTAYPGSLWLSPRDVYGGSDTYYPAFSTVSHDKFVATSETQDAMVVISRTNWHWIDLPAGMAFSPRFTAGDKSIVFTYLPTPESDHPQVDVVDAADGSPPRALLYDSQIRYAAGDLSSDGTSVYVLARSNRGTAVLRAPLDGSPPVEVLPPGEYLSLPSVAARDTTPPNQVTDLAGYADGTTARLSWKPPASVDYSHVVVRRTTGGPPTTSPTGGTAVYSGRANSTTDTIQPGHTYHYSVFAIDGAGNASYEAAVSVTGQPRPAMSLPALASDDGTRLRARVSWRSGSASATRYVVQWAPLGRAFRPWLGSFASPVTTTSAVFGYHGHPSWLLPGMSYRVRVWSVDGAGNRSVPTTRTVTMPFDDRTALVTRGWHNWSRRDAWLGTWRGTRVKGASIGIRLSGRRFVVIGDKLPQGGRFAVYLGGRYMGTAGTWSSTLRTRRVLWRSPVLPWGTRILRVVNLATAGHPQLDIDGFAAAP